MKIGDSLPIMDDVSNLMNAEYVISKGCKIAKNGKRGNRSPELHLAHSIIGVAIEIAVMRLLISMGYDVKPAPDGHWWYDMIVNGLLVDVKSMLDGKFFSQTEDEAHKLKSTGERVLYLCVQALHDGYVFRGASWIEELHPSHYNRPFVTIFHDMFDPT